jgi:hypothetical protein
LAKGRKAGREDLAQEALAAVLACADRMEERAVSLLQVLPELPMDAKLRTAASDLGTGLKDTAGRVMFELALLRARVDEGRADDAAVVRKLAGLDAAMMTALAPLADLADRLEVAAERDEANERAFVLVIESAGAMLQSLNDAKEATQALQAGLSSAT